MQRVSGHINFQVARLRLCSQFPALYPIGMTVTTNGRQGKPMRRLPACFRDTSTVAKDDGQPSSSYTRIISDEARQRQLLFKATIEKLPVIDHRPSHKLYCSKSPSETNFLIKRMIKEGNVFGLDLEWRPTFVKGSKENKTALIQLCNAESVLIIQISRMHVFPKELKSMLQDRNIIKTGVSIRGDALKLYRDFRILTNGLVDLGALARSTKAKELEDHAGLSLRLLCGIYLGKSLPKGAVRLSRWDAPFLSSKQKQYAADDAYVSILAFYVVCE
ncbi:unnamed protein product [Umbelopsis sp. WA50703]